MEDGLTNLGAAGSFRSLQANIGIVPADSRKYPLLADLTSDFVYQRLPDAKAEIETGYGLEALDTWMALARFRERGDEPEQLPLTAAKDGKHMAREVFIYFINGAKLLGPERHRHDRGVHAGQSCLLHVG